MVLRWEYDRICILHTKPINEDNLNKKIYSLFILIICFLCIFALAACKDNNIVIDPDQLKIADGITIEYIDTSKFSFDSNLDVPI